MFNKTVKNLDGRTPVHIQGVATVDEINELKRITGTTSNQAALRALINEKLYKKVEA